MSNEKVKTRSKSLAKSSVKTPVKPIVKTLAKSPEIDGNQLWASRFSKTTDPISKRYTESVTIDRPMVLQSIWGSEAHVIMLAKQGIIKDLHCKKILEALQEIKKEYSAGTWDLSLQEEDAQMNIERYAIEKVGIENAGRMHTCRSRNDQVPLDTKLYTRDRLIEVIENVTQMVDVLLKQADSHTETLMPGYTHIQHAQPITYAYWLTHHVAVFLRDTKRLLAAYDTNDSNPLGAGAISGTSFPIDRKLTTELLGFKTIQEHALDAIGNKDSTIEILSVMSILFATISRIANEIIYNISCEFDTMILDDGFSMGSSMMPQKKNPGVLELVRGRTGKMYGMLMHMLTLMKGLHSGYNRDYHEDKVTLVEGLQLTNETIEVIKGVMETLKIKKERMEFLATQNFATATELANYLVKKHDIPFRLCHRIVGHVVRALVAEGKNFTDKKRTKELLAEKDIKISDVDYDQYLTPKHVIKNYDCIGGVAPKEVTRMIREMRKTNSVNKKEIDAIKNRIVTAQQKTAKIVNLILKQNKTAEQALKAVL